MTAERACPECGLRNPVEQSLCTQCGAELSLRAQAEQLRGRLVGGSYLLETIHVPQELGSPTGRSRRRPGAGSS